MMESSGKMNPGPWIEHSKVAAGIAKAIAERCPEMDADAAYVLGLLHDIGRREGYSHIRHVLDGYNYLMKEGYPDAAEICLTHSFPTQDIAEYVGDIDCSQDDFEFIDNFLKSKSYTDYDKLIQLCDALSYAQGAVLMEKRLVNVVMRYGLCEKIINKWKMYFDLKQYFDILSNCNVYTLLDNIVNNTFEW